MKTLWCWRCQKEVPMFDESEFLIAHKLYGVGFHNLNVSLSDREKRFSELWDWHIQQTGVSIGEPNAIFHHRIVLYGPPCEKCNKPYRTPKASFCAACGNKRKLKSQWWPLN